MFNTLQNVIEKLPITGVFHWECKEEWLCANSGTDECLSWLTESHRQLSQHCFCVIQCKGQTVKKQVFSIILTMVLNPKHTTLRMLNWGRISIFQIRHSYTRYICVYMSINYGLVYTEIWDPPSYRSKWTHHCKPQYLFNYEMGEVAMPEC